MSYFLLDKAVLESFLDFTTHGITVTDVSMPDPSTPVIVVSIAGEGLPEGRCVPIFQSQAGEAPTLRNIEPVCERGPRNQH